MIRKFAIAILGCCLCAAPGVCAEGKAAPPTSAGSYIATYGGSGLYRMRLSDGSLYEFELAQGTTNRIVGADQWHGSIAGDVTTVRSAPAADPTSKLYRFKGGRLTGFAEGKAPLANAEQGAWPELPLIALWPPEADAEQVMDEFDPWRDAKYLKLGFVNPNRCGAFLMLLSLVFCGFAALVRRRWPRIALLLCAAALFVAVLLTHSRGAVVAFTIGLSCYSLPKMSRLPRRYQVIFAAAFVFLLVAGIFACYGKTGSPPAKSSEQRINIWRYAPRMIADSPGGWGFVSSGRAYVDWYQPLGESFVSRTLINDHLTILVSCGWPLRVGYLLAWFLALGLAFKAARGGKTAMPLSVWSALAAAAWFNPLLESPLMWIAPSVAGAVFAVRAEPWRRSGRYARVFLPAAVLALASAAVIYAVGNFTLEPRPGVRTRGETVLVNGINPSTLIVSDDVVLGVGLTEKQLRAFYEKNPKAPAIAYAYGVDALPARLPWRLVLAGRRGAEFLDRWVSAPEGAKPELPGELTFISPTFPPWAVPEEVMKSCKVKIVIGEFLARFDPGYASPPPWVEIVPGDELCVHDWVARTVMPGFVTQPSAPLPK